MYMGHVQCANNQEMRIAQVVDNIRVGAVESMVLINIGKM